MVRDTCAPHKDFMAGIVSEASNNPLGLSGFILSCLKGQVKYGRVWAEEINRRIANHNGNVSDTIHSYAGLGKQLTEEQRKSLIEGAIEGYPESLQAAKFLRGINP
jgi:hypothetical protein